MLRFRGIPLQPVNIMRTISHIFGVIVIAVIGVVVLRPEVVRDFYPRAIETVTTTAQSVGRLTPTTLITYLDSIEPIHRTGTDTSLATDSIIEATNRERIKAGLMPLRSNVHLTQSAMVKTNDMIARNYFEHDSPDGTAVSDLVLDAGYDYVIVGENLARGNFVDATDLITEWMNSPGHRANMLSPKYQEIGAYVAQGTFEDRTVWFAVQHFGTDRNTCPTISTKLKPEIDAMNADLNQRRAQISNEKALLVGPAHPEGEEYKERVAAFNGLVANYNTALVLSQEKIKIYNAQVAAFNVCLGLYRPVN